MEPSMNDKPAFIYYMNDGVYGSFANKLMENFNVIPIVHKKYNEEGTIFASSLWGPSSDGLDQVVEHCVLPELNVGDWVIFENMGANTLGQQSTFSEVQRPPLYYLMSVSDWYEMHEAGITRDTSLKNFFFVPSCFLLRYKQSQRLPVKS
uniref:Orn/DAP/Arg decarboxylase 2 C-terminal domain-containing protein n=1 Tax=Latimeria chalumnae TaxID=7897 RepID=H3B1N6_LATCH